MNRRFQILLIVGGDFVGRDILPFELITHPATRNDGHLQPRPPKTPILHRQELPRIHRRAQSAADDSCSSSSSNLWGEDGSAPKFEDEDEGRAREESPSNRHRCRRDKHSAPRATHWPLQISAPTSSECSRSE